MAYTRAQIDAVISNKLGGTAFVDRLRAKGDGAGDATLKIRMDTVRTCAQHVAKKTNNGLRDLHPAAVERVFRRFLQHFVDVKALP